MRFVVGLVSQKGGVGKSTLARALAATALRGGINARIADRDPQQQTVGRWEQRREEHGISPAVPVVVVKSAAEAFAVGSAEDYLLIIDGEARSNAGTLEISSRADLVVQPSGVGLDDLDPAINLFRQLVARGIPKDKLVMVLCRVGSDSGEAYARRLIEAEGFFVLKGAIPEKAGYTEAHNRGLAITEATHKSLRETAEHVANGLFEIISEKMRQKVQAQQKHAKQAG